MRDLVQYFTSIRQQTENEASKFKGLHVQSEFRCLDKHLLMSSLMVKQICLVLKFSFFIKHENGFNSMITITCKESTFEMIVLSNFTWNCYDEKQIAS